MAEAARPIVSLGGGQAPTVARIAPLATANVPDLIAKLNELIVGYNRIGEVLRMWNLAS